MIKCFGRNTAGRDFAVGDVHGHFTRLQAALGAARFDPQRDRLFSVGDLVDRGPESELVLDWLDKPWFHAVRGNHEQMTINAHRQGEEDLHFMNGGAWFCGLPSAERDGIALRLDDLPLVIEVETKGGLVGLMHADCPAPTWRQLRAALTLKEVPASLRERVIEACIWSRERIYGQDESGVEGIRALVVGHTPLRQPAVLGNVYHIDTAGWMDGHFTLLDLSTLACMPPINPKLHWDWEVS